MGIHDRHINRFVEFDRMSIDSTIDDGTDGLTFNLSNIVLKNVYCGWSHSTMVTCFAPRKAAPIPRTPLPAPKSRTCLSVNPSPRSILVSQAAARFPPLDIVQVQRIGMGEAQAMRVASLDAVVACFHQRRCCPNCWLNCCCCCCICALNWACCIACWLLIMSAI